MLLKSISLQQIRSHESLNIDFQVPVTVIVGPNASGKTTVVEAIHLAATGDSFRASAIDEMIALGAELGRIKAVAEIDAGTDEVEVLLTRGLVQGKRTSKRLFTVNGVKRRRQDTVGKFQTVVFRPEDMRLIEGSPGRRRSFLNEALAPLSREYAHSLKTYDQTLIRRNRLLSQIQEGKQNRASLQYWNMTLLKHGEHLQTLRRDFLGTYNHVLFPLALSVRYIPSVMSQDRMNEYAEREVAAGHTLIGPHKDDFEVSVTKNLHTLQAWPLGTYGSRGEQRMGVLWLKFGQLQFILESTGQKPIWLLDDILSELDHAAQEKVLTAVRDYQTVITTTDQHLLPLIDKFLHKTQVITFTGATL